MTPATRSTRRFDLIPAVFTTVHVNALPPESLGISAEYGLVHVNARYGYLRQCRRGHTEVPS